MQKITCNNSQKVKLTANPDHPIDGALKIEVLEGDGSFEQDPNDPLSFKAVSGSLPADTDLPDTVAVTRFKVSADGDRGAGVVTIEDEVELTVTQPIATNLGLVVSPAEPK